MKAQRKEPEKKGIFEDEREEERRVQSLGQEDPGEEGMATPSSILARRIPWTGEPGGPQSIGSQRVGHN